MRIQHRSYYYSYQKDKRAKRGNVQMKQSSNGCLLLLGRRAEATPACSVYVMELCKELPNCVSRLFVIGTACQALREPEHSVSDSTHVYIHTYIHTHKYIIYVQIRLPESIV